ncbi:MAG TPA: phosphoglycerate mutase (2,3-diphosphoglycerate-independent) [Anaerolineaceae bacterium]|nr:phosphoglycerate mutase (2,3-diphosphoglycerate-independent) [Anaerolineaceae bacterium]
MVLHRIKNSGSVLAGTVREMYSEGQTDYSFEPVVLVDNQGNAIGEIQENDAVIFCCRRGEREIQLTEAFTEPNFNQFEKIPFKNLPFVILTLYHDKFKDLPVAFAPVKMQETLGEVVSKAGLNQARISESEKFAHVTFFLNGGNNAPYPGEMDIRVPSPKGISYDKVPELKLDEVADKVIERIEQKDHLIVTNFANGDVIGHTSNREAKIKCAEVVDRNLSKVVEAAKDAGYVILITADHGNLEELFNEDGTPNVSHTTNLVDFILLDPDTTSPISLKNGKLGDIAPTILKAMGLNQPPTMTGSNLALDHHFGENRKVLLIILDGWGIGKKDETNPIYLAKTPYWDQLLATQAKSTLEASGEAVGLKAGKAGNSEAGHMNIGAGRVVLQDDVRLDAAMKDGSFYSNPTILQAIDHAINNKSKLHLIGLMTIKSSHGSIDYPLAVLKMAKERGLEDVCLHMIFDGRSTEPGSAPSLLEMMDEKVNEIGIGQIVSGIGRGIALDRDGNYSKTQKAYIAFVFGKGRPSFIK